MLPARTDPSWNFDRISEGLRTRDPATIHHLIDEYGNAVLAVVRSRLPAKLRREFDSLDFTQEVWAGLASGNREATAFRNRDEVVAYLSQMARNRVISAIRSRLTGVVCCPSGGRETGPDRRASQLSGFGPTKSGRSVHGDQKIIARVPSK